MDKYLKDPIAIEEKSFAMIKAQTDLSGFTEQQQQIVMRLVHTCGNPDIVSHIKISADATSIGVRAIKDQGSILCDVEMVKQGLTKRYLETEPRCFLNDAQVPTIAQQNHESRSMTALELWQPYIKDSICIIGNAPTALYRLMEMIENGCDKPALIIGIPVGFVGAAESKDYLWQHYQSLGVECITITGRTGGSALAAGAFNTLVRLKRGLRF